MKNICIVGYGAMGKLLAEKVKNDPELNLVGIVDKIIENEKINKDINEISEKIDGIIDFSHPSNIDMIYSYCKKNQTALLYCTTGYTVNQKEKLEELSKFCPTCITGNTSIGINLIKSVLPKFAEILNDFDVEIIEKHHNKKKDAPSGTAKMFLSELKKANPSLIECYGRKDFCPRQQNEIGVHAVRGGTIAGEHSVIFAGEDEIIEIKHTALSKNLFVNGSIKIIKYLLECNLGNYSSEQVFHLK